MPPYLPIPTFNYGTGGVVRWDDRPAYRGAVGPLIGGSALSLRGRAGARDAVADLPVRGYKTWQGQYRFRGSAGGKSLGQSGGGLTLFASL